MTLYLVATPIGNWQDLSERARRTLKSCDLILCEDTRTSMPLLRHYELTTPLLSYHKFNEQANLELIIQRLECGESIALISDAGTPCLCDPGQRLVEACRLRGHKVIPLPGACSIVTALCASGLEGDSFQFLGFSPKTAQQKRKMLAEALRYPHISLFFESPHRILATLELLHELAPQRQLVLAKELTKKFEAFLYGSACELLNQFKESEDKELTNGEWIIMVSAFTPTKAAPSADIAEACTRALALQAKGLSRRDSVTAVSQLLPCDAQDLYKALEELA